jgi:hypothetical protein
MSFIKKPTAILTDLTDSKKLATNLKRFEEDELMIIAKIKEYDKSIFSLDQRIQKKGNEIGSILNKLKGKKPSSSQYKALIRQRNKLRIEQHKMMFLEQANILKKQDELVHYYRDLIEIIKIIQKMKKLKKDQTERVKKTISQISLHID